MIQVYGIPNCDTVKKAITWLKENKIAFEFHDFKKEGVSPTKLMEWLKLSPLEKMLNKKSIAFKNLSPQEQQNTVEINEAVLLMQANTNLIKRPVVEIAGTVLHGFQPDEFKKAFGIN